MMHQNKKGCMKPHPMPPMQPCTSAAQPVICPAQYCFHDTFMPQELPVVHPFVNVTRQHTVQIPRHYYTEVNETMPGQTVQAMPGRGPWGPHMRPWRKC